MPVDSCVEIVLYFAQQKKCNEFVDAGKQRFVTPCFSLFACLKSKPAQPGMKQANTRTYPAGNIIGDGQIPFFKPFV